MRRGAPLALLVAAALLAGTAWADPSASSPPPFQPPDDPDTLMFGGDAQKGWELFRTKRCISCHAIWGQGGDAAPDLGRVVLAPDNATASHLAGTMWNHVPRMWEEMAQHKIRITDVTAAEMSHLFAFLLYVRMVDEPGDAALGERALVQYGCSRCHAIGGEGGNVGPDLERWARFVNPIVWAQKMWNHASGMESQMAEMGIAWPTMGSNHLVNIIAYIRSRGIAASKEYLTPGSAQRGQRLFRERGCADCHRSATDSRRGGSGRAPDLERVALPETVAGMASSMWNHAPAMQRAMRRRGSHATTLEAQEMADIIAYVLTRRYFRTQGDAAAGAEVFVAKGCITCHTLDTRGGKIGPELTQLRGQASPVFMAYVMWRWGPKMLEKMTRRGMHWPYFEGEEMPNLVAFLGQASPRR